MYVAMIAVDCLFIQVRRRVVLSRIEQLIRVVRNVCIQLIVPICGFIGRICLQQIVSPSRARLNLDNNGLA